MDALNSRIIVRGFTLPLFHWGVLLLLTPLLIGCMNSVTEAAREGTISVRTDQASYTVSDLPSEFRLEIEVSVTNESSEPVYLSVCSGLETGLFQLEKQVEGQWVTAFVPICLMDFRPPIEIPPGVIHREVAVARNVYGALPQFGVDDISGRYRLRYGLHRTWDPSAPDPNDRIRDSLAEAERISNEFSVVW